MKFDNELKYWTSMLNESMRDEAADDRSLRDSYKEHCSKALREDEGDTTKFLQLARTMNTLLTSGDVGNYLLPDDKNQRNVVVQWLKSVAGDASNIEACDEVLADSSFSKFLGSTLKTLPLQVELHPEDAPFNFFFVKDGHGDEVVVIARLRDDVWLAACKGDGFDTPKQYFTFYDANGECLNGNRDETWLDIYPLMSRVSTGSRLSCSALRNINRDQAKISSKEAEEILTKSGFRKYVG